MLLPTHFISCDWGTTNFRLRVVRTATLETVATVPSGHGVRALNVRFAAAKRTDRAAFFAAYLRGRLEALPAAHRGHPVVVSGMASANIGMRELPYGELPLGRGGEGLIFRDLTGWPGRQLRLISGLKSATGMMRGEETQALGLLEVLPPGEDGTLLLPGTHCKHLRYAGGCFTAFTSFMTGELFEALSAHSILAQSVEEGAWNARAGEVFADGVRAGFTGGAAAHLFSVRAGQVLRGAPGVEGYYRLSGLLIGDELRSLPAAGAGVVYLAGSGALSRLYHRALEVVRPNGRLVVYKEEVLDRALLTGQRILLGRS